MKGLLLKDFCILKNYYKIPVGIVFILSAVLLSGGGSTESGIFGIIIMMFMIMSISSFSLDGQPKWDSFILLTPDSRRNVVFGKYAVSIILILTGAVVSLVACLALSAFGVFDNPEEQLTVIYFVTLLSFVFISVILPLLYKLGAEKGRLVIFVVCFIPLIITTVMSRMSVSMPSEEDIMRFFGLLPFFVPALLILSYLISCGIYLKKEF